MKFKNSLLFLFYLLAGIILGSMVASFAADISFLSWLSYGREIGFASGSPAVLDFIIFKVWFGFSLGISVAQILTVGLAMYIYRKTR